MGRVFAVKQLLFAKLAAVALQYLAMGGDILRTALARDE
jgi:hypothetical protein